MFFNVLFFFSNWIYQNSQPEEQKNCNCPIKHKVKCCINNKEEGAKNYKRFNGRFLESFLGTDPQASSF